MTDLAREIREWLVAMSALGALVLAPFSSAYGQLLAYPLTDANTSLCSVPDAPTSVPLLVLSDESHGCEPWTSDGTPQGTTLLADSYPLINGSYPRSFKDALGTTFFFAKGTSSGLTLWRTDGSPATTTVIASFPDAFSEYGYAYYLPRYHGVLPSGRLAFSVYVPNLSRWQGWATDGTPAGTQLLVPYFADDPTVLPQGALFNRCDDASYGCEPWISDGTAAGTQLLQDVWPGPSSGFGRYFAAIGGKIYFVACDPTNGCEPWVSDGTPAGTALLKDIWPGASASVQYTKFFDLGGRAVFVADDGVNGTELWTSDGTTAGTTLLVDIGPGPSPGVSPYLGVAFGGRLLFTANDGATGSEPWITDGTPAGTQRLADITAGSASTSVGSMVPLGSSLLFLVYTPTTVDLWGTDGTPSGTQVLYSGFGRYPEPQIYPYSVYRIEHDGKLFFWAVTPGTGSEPWVTDGTVAGTHSLDINPGPDSSGPDDFFEDYPFFDYYDGFSRTAFVARGAGVYFNADDGTHGFEVWRSDGTPAGTTLTKDLYPGLGSSNARYAVAGAQGLAFQASDGLVASSLFLDEGGAEGPQPVGNSPQYVSNPIVLDGNILFSASDYTTYPYVQNRLYAIGAAVDGCLPVPRDDCKEALAGGKASLQLKDKTPDANDQVQLKATIAEPTQKSDFGSPSSTTSYRLCVYDGNEVFLSAAAPAGTGWTETPSGFVFKGAASAEIDQVSLKASPVPGRTKILAKGKGEALVMPALGGVAGPVKAQLVAEDSGACWAATFDAPFRKNSTTELNARSE